MLFLACHHEFFDFVVFVFLFCCWLMLLLRVVFDGMRSLGTHHFNRRHGLTNQINPTMHTLYTQLTHTMHLHTHTHTLRTYTYTHTFVPYFFNVRRNVVLLWTAMLGMLSIRLGYFVYIYTLHAVQHMQKIHTKHLYRYADRHNTQRDHILSLVEAKECWKKKYLRGHA